mgnify:CR=1 FL=1
MRARGRRERERDVDGGRLTMHVGTDDRAIAPASMRFDRDYQVMPHVDRYEVAGLAEDEEE